jgi:ketosteroid isomerase-like protein
VSQADVETVRQVYELWNSAEGMQAALALLDPEVEYVNPESAIDAGVRRGHTGMTEVLQALDGRSPSTCTRSSDSSMPATRCWHT